MFGTAGAGWRVDRIRFEKELASAAIAAGVDWRCGHANGGLLPTAAAWLVTCGSSTTGGIASDEADVVVDASGRAARVARLLGARRVRYDRLVGVAGLRIDRFRRAGCRLSC